jgi:hypothetical protein
MFFEKFLEFGALAKNRHGRPMKCLRYNTYVCFEQKECVGFMYKW